MQLTYRESLCDIEACLRSQTAKLYHMGFCSTVARNTLANAKAVRDCRINADFAQSLIIIARKFCAEESFGVDLSSTVDALDATTIDLCLLVFPWAPFRSTKSVKIHTLPDLRGNFSSFTHIIDGKWHEANLFDTLVREARGFYIMNRRYRDFEQLHRLHQAESFYVIRAKSNPRFKRRCSLESDRAAGVICNQIGTLTDFHAIQDHPTPLLRVRIKDDEGKTLLSLPPYSPKLAPIE